MGLAVISDAQRQLFGIGGAWWRPPLIQRHIKTDEEWAEYCYYWQHRGLWFWEYEYLDPLVRAQRWKQGAA
jgi:hypothetical protein